MIDINELTVKQIKEIAAAFPSLFDMAQSSTPMTASITADVIGRYVIVRSQNEGVNAGYVEKADDTGIVLRDARRLWYHRPAVETESWYEGVANHGLATGCKISAPVAIKIIVEGYSITPCTDKARRSIMEYESHAQK